VIIAGARCYDCIYCIHTNSFAFTIKMAATSRVDPKSIIRHEDQVVKSSEGSNKYKAFELANGLKILLISDKETDKSAASLDINVGALSRFSVNIYEFSLKHESLIQDLCMIPRNCPAWHTYVSICYLWAQKRFE